MKCLKDSGNTEGLSCRRRECKDYEQCEHSLHCKGEAAKKRLQQRFKEDPELKAAFKETIEEMKQPENIEKMAKQTCAFMAAVQNAIGGTHGKRN